MALYALDDLDDAIDVSKRFLLPFDVRRWLKLALVTFFVGVPGGNFFQFNTGPGSVDRPAEVPGEFAVGPELLAVLVAFVIAAIVVGLLFLLVGSIMELVLVESLRNETVAVRRYWSRRWRQGLRLFGFRIALGVLTLVPMGLALAIVVVPFFLTGEPFSLFGLVLLVPVFFVVGLLAALIGGFTTAFVVPIMILEGCGVLAGWRRLWPTIRSQWKQYAAYAVMAFVLAIAAGILVGIAMVVLAVALLIPFGLLGALGFGLLSTSTVAGWAILAIAGVLFLLALLTGFAIVGVPVVTYLRYYALLVLGDTNDSFDIIPDQRAAARESGAE